MKLAILIVFIMPLVALASLDRLPSVDKRQNGRMLDKSGKGDDDMDGKKKGKKKKMEDANTCSIGTTSFVDIVTFVFLETVDPDETARAYAAAYNTFAECLQRVLIEYELLASASGSTVDSSMNRNLQLSLSTISFTFKFTGTCSACGSQSTTFSGNSGNNRILKKGLRGVTSGTGSIYRILDKGGDGESSDEKTSESKSKKGKKGKGDGECLPCPAGVDIPTLEQVVDVFTENIGVTPRDVEQVEDLSAQCTSPIMLQDLLLVNLTAGSGDDGILTADEIAAAEDAACTAFNEVSFQQCTEFFLYCDTAEVQRIEPDMERKLVEEPRDLQLSLYYSYIITFNVFCGGSSCSSQTKVFGSNSGSARRLSPRSSSSSLNGIAHHRRQSEATISICGCPMGSEPENQPISREDTVTTLNDILVVVFPDIDDPVQPDDTGSESLACNALLEDCSGTCGLVIPCFDDSCDPEVPVEGSIAEQRVLPGKENLFCNSCRDDTPDYDLNCCLGLISLVQNEGEGALTTSTTDLLCGLCVEAEHLLFFPDVYFSACCSGDNLDEVQCCASELPPFLIPEACGCDETGPEQPVCNFCNSQFTASPEGSSYSLPSENVENFCLGCSEESAPTYFDQDRIGTDYADACFDYCFNSELSSIPFPQCCHAITPDDSRVVEGFDFEYEYRGSCCSEEGTTYPGCSAFME